MPDSPTSLYLSLTHAVAAAEVSSGHIKEHNADDGGPLFVLGVRGECVCGDEWAETAVLLNARIAAGVIVQLTACLRDSGMSDDLIAALVAAEEALRQDVDHPDAGRLRQGCPHCRRAQPECVCAHRWAVR